MIVNKQQLLTYSQTVQKYHKLLENLEDEERFLERILDRLTQLSILISSSNSSSNSQSQRTEWMSCNIRTLSQYSRNDQLSSNQPCYTQLPFLRVNIDWKRYAFTACKDFNLTVKVTISPSNRSFQKQISVKYPACIDIELHQELEIPANVHLNVYAYPKEIVPVLDCDYDDDDLNRFTTKLTSINQLHHHKPLHDQDFFQVFQKFKQLSSSSSLALSVYSTHQRFDLIDFIQPVLITEQNNHEYQYYQQYMSKRLPSAADADADYNSLEQCDKPIRWYSEQDFHEAKLQISMQHTSLENVNLDFKRFLSVILAGTGSRNLKRIIHKAGLAYFSAPQSSKPIELRCLRLLNVAVVGDKSSSAPQYQSELELIISCSDKLQLVRVFTALKLRCVQLSLINKQQTTDGGNEEQPENDDSLKDFIQHGILVARIQNAIKI